MIHNSHNSYSDNDRTPILFLILTGVPLFFFFVYTAFLHFSITAQFWIGWGSLALIIFFTRCFDRSPEIQRIIIVLICLFLAVRYWLFRVTDTLIYVGLADFIALLLLFSAESYAIFTYILGMFVNIYPIRRQIKRVDLENPNLPTVDVFIPTFNEPETIVSTTMAAAKRINYPSEKLNIYLLDDGGTLELRRDPNPVKASMAQERHQNLKSLAASMGVKYLTREKNIHAKAGNINEALLKDCPEEALSKAALGSCMAMGEEGSNGDLILILDCDHVPTRDILENTVGFFMKDERLFLVQTPHFFINPDPVEKNLATFLEKPSENEMFYGGVHLGLDFWNASFFCGSAAILRRKHLAEIGGISGETITEDAETALKLHARGLNSIYIARPMVCGLSPETFADFILQRNRWAQGMTQILMLKNPLFLKGLTFAQRICYFNTCIFWFFGLSRLIFFLAPLGYLFFGWNIYPADLSQVLAYTAPTILASMILSNYMFGDLRHPFFSELYEVVQSIYNMPAVIGAVVRPRSPVFKTTPKNQTLTSDVLSPLAVPFYFMLIIALVGLPMAAYRWYFYPFERDAVYITLFWNCFNLLLVLLCLGAVWEKRQLRKKHRIRTREKITVQPEGDSQSYPAVVFDLSEAGVGFTLPQVGPFVSGGRAKIHAVDSTGHHYTLSIVLRRVDPHEGGLVCGAEFSEHEGKAWIDIVSYVYGDSQRWENFWNQRRLVRENAWSGITYLAFKGLTGSARNFSGLIKVVWIKFIHSGEYLWHYIKPVV